MILTSFQLVIFFSRTLPNWTSTSNQTLNWKIQEKDETGHFPYGLSIILCKVKFSFALLIHSFTFHFHSLVYISLIGRRKGRYWSPLSLKETLIPGCFSPDICLKIQWGFPTLGKKRMNLFFSSSTTNPTSECHTSTLVSACLKNWEFSRISVLCSRRIFSPL